MKIKYRSHPKQTLQRYWTVKVYIPYKSTTALNVYLFSLRQITNALQKCHTLDCLILTQHFIFADKSNIIYTLRQF